MVGFSILLSSSSSQGPLPQPYNLCLEAVTASCQRRNFTCLASGHSNVLWLDFFVLLQALFVSAALLGFSQHLLAVLLPREAAPVLRPWKAATAKGEQQRTSQRRKQTPSHISAPRNKPGTGAVVARAFLWQSHQLMQSSPRLTLSSFGTYVILQ